MKQKNFQNNVVFFFKMKVIICFSIMNIHHNIHLPRTLIVCRKSANAVLDAVDIMVAVRGQVLPCILESGKGNTGAWVIRGATGTEAHREKPEKRDLLHFEKVHFVLNVCFHSTDIFGAI